MKILYGSNSCSYKKYNELFKNSKVMILQQAQKYHSLMAAGLAAGGAKVKCISALPVNRAYTKKIYINGGNETENGIDYHYFGFINFSFLKRLIIMLKSFFYIITKGDYEAVVCDILNISIFAGMLFAAKIKRIPIIGIVTDLPENIAGKSSNNMYDKINTLLLKKCNGYVFLTEKMNTSVNINNKPYIVIEGQADADMIKRDNFLSDKEKPKIMLYAGSLKRIYGIDKLISAFAKLNPDNWEFHIYGDGDYAGELKKITRLNSNIKYHGVRLNNYIIEREITASLLVNPRPTKYEYTKYSFPSKNMEYMSTGTPLLTTCLPGIPEEYYPYVYLFGGESTDEMAETLGIVLSHSCEKLHEKGMSAKKFVLKEKNNTIQALKLLELIERINV